MTPQPVPTAPAGRPRWIIPVVVTVLAVLMLGAIAVGIAVLAALQGRPAVAGSTSAPSASWSPHYWSPVASPSPVPPDLARFTITVKILEKTCFGSAGCNLTYQVTPSYSGPPVTGSWLVTYSVTGCEGDQINTMRLVGDGASFDEEEFCQTPSSKTELTAKATSVTAGG